MACYPTIIVSVAVDSAAHCCRAGEHPLMRLVLQPPTDGLLQPGGTFGLLLDFRAAHGAAAAASNSQPVCLQVSCVVLHLVAVRQ
jgi:hypothetical protein